MGFEFTLEESDFAGYIEDGEIYNAELVHVNQSERQFQGEPAPVMRLGFRFRLESDDAHDGAELWGETSTKYVNHPGCKLKQWADALMGQELPAGYNLNTDTLLGRRCRVIVEKREYNDRKTGEAKTLNKVREVHPTREALLAMQDAAQEDF